MIKNGYYLEKDINCLRFKNPLLTILKYVVNTASKPSCWKVVINSLRRT